MQLRAPPGAHEERCPVASQALRLRGEARCVAQGPDQAGKAALFTAKKVLQGKTDILPGVTKSRSNGFVPSDLGGPGASVVT